MIVRGVGRAIAGLAFVLAVSACDDNPLAEDRDVGSYFRLNPSNVVVNTGGTVKVDASVMNRYGAATNDPVSATVCDARISAAADPERSDFEFPERFVISGLTFGESCLVVTGGGLTDTIGVRVVPATVDIQYSEPGDTLLESGDIRVLPVSLRSVGGAVAPGVTVDDRTVLSVSDDAVGSIDQDGTFIARAPGATFVIASFTDLGVTRRDSVQIVVVPAVFTGTATQVMTSYGLQAVQFTAGGIPFDENTFVEFVALPDPVEVPDSRTATTMTYFIPPVVGADSTVTFRILQAGENESTVEGEFTTGASAIDGNGSMATATPLAVGDSAWGIIAGVRGAQEWFQVTVTQAGTYRISFEWFDDQDKDAYVVAADGTTLLALEHGATTNPETDVIDLEPGTYYLRGETWTPNPGADALYVMSFTLVP